MTRRALLLGLIGCYPGICGKRKEPAKPAVKPSECLLRLSTISRKMTGPKVDEAARFLRAIADYLDPDEAAAHLHGLDTVRIYVRDLLEANFLGVAKIIDRCQAGVIVHAFVNGKGSDIPDGEAAIIVNEEGAFWNPRHSIRGLRGTTNKCRLLLLLHELSHALNSPDFEMDLDSVEASDRNNVKVLNRFPKTFKAINKIRFPKI
jgi:hypothetical protein